MSSSAYLNPLVEKIRTKFPGAYDDMDDAELTKRVLNKYPQYSDLAAPALQQPVQVESSATDKVLGTLAPHDVPKTPNAGASQEGMPGFEGSYASNDLDKAAAMTVAGAAAATAISPIGRKIAPYIAPAVGSYAISQARKIPIIGPVIDKIPFAEAIPWLMSGKKEEEPKPTFPKTKLGPEAPPPEVGMSRGLGGYQTPDAPSVGLGKIQVAPQPEVPQVRALPSGQYEAPASPVRPPAQLGTGVIEGEYMPEPGPVIRGQLPRGAIQRPGGFEPNQPALPARGEPIRLPAEFTPPQQPIIRTTPSQPLKPIAPEVAPAAKPAVDVKPAKVGDLLNEGLGGRPLQPNVPLRQQMTAKAPNAPQAESSVIKSYSYDPAKREFTSVTPTGATYIHGDVSPEQAAEFEANPSKGKAWNTLRQNSTYVGKVVNGQRVNAQPPKALASASPADAAAPKAPAVGEDLTGILQRSVEAAKKKRGR